jgi:hypothetical protein
VAALIIDLALQILKTATTYSYLRVDGYGTEGEQLANYFAARLKLASELGGCWIDSCLQLVLFWAAAIQLNAYCGFGNTAGVSVQKKGRAKRDVHSVLGRLWFTMADLDRTGQVFNPAGRHQTSSKSSYSKRASKLIEKHTAFTVPDIERASLQMLWIFRQDEILPSPKVGI